MDGLQGLCIQRPIKELLVLEHRSRGHAFLISHLYDGRSTHKERTASWNRGHIGTRS